MDENQVSLLLNSYMKSKHRKKTIPERKKKFEHNHNWINLDKIEDMPDEELKDRFLKYYQGGEGRQVFTQIWRDRIVRDMDRFRSMLLYLLGGDDSVEKRFTEVVDADGEYHIDGVGKGLASAFLMDFDKEEYCIWNNKTERGFTTLGWELPYRSSDDMGTKYVKILDQLKRLRDEIGRDLDLDFLDVDLFLHWVAAEEEGKREIKNLIGEEGMEELGVEVKPQKEKFVQPLIEQQFNELFAPHLELYEGDPDQTGAQFTTPVGRIDFLAVDKETDDFVVIELKIGKVKDSAIGQVLRYMGYVEDELAEDEKVRGMILGEELGDKAEYALNRTSNIEFKEFKINVQIEGSSEKNAR